MRKNRIFILFVAMILLFCGCSIQWEDSATAGERVENEPAGQLQGGQSQSDTSDRKDSETHALQESNSAASGNGAGSVISSHKNADNVSEYVELGGCSAVEGVSLYKDTVYYHVDQGGEAGPYMFSMKLEKGQSPQYMGRGRIYGVYDGFLVGGINGKCGIMDLSQRNSKWEIVPVETSDGGYGNDEVLGGKSWVQYQSQLWVFGQKEGQPYLKIIDFKKKSGWQMKIDFSVQEAAVFEDVLVYLVQSTDESVLYKADVKTKKAVALYRGEKGIKWQCAGGRIFVYKAQDEKYPFVIDLANGNSFIPKDIEKNNWNFIEFSKVSNNEIKALCFDPDHPEKGNFLWKYHIARDIGKTVKNADLDTEYPLKNGGYYCYTAEEQVSVVVGDKKYALNTRACNYRDLDDANEYGAVAGGREELFVVWWSGKGLHTYEVFPSSEHRIPADELFS